MMSCIEYEELRNVKMQAHSTCFVNAFHWKLLRLRAANTIFVIREIISENINYWLLTGTSNENGL